MMQRRPRQHNEAHLRFIRGLPCAICGDDTSTEAAHVRFADRSIAKLNSGLSAKPDDRFVVPLCGKHHRDQHEHGEARWWLSKGIDPVKTALALWSAECDYEEGLRIVAATRERAAA